MGPKHRKNTFQMSLGERYSGKDLDGKESRGSVSKGKGPDFWVN